MCGYLFIYFNINNIYYYLSVYLFVFKKTFNIKTIIISSSISINNTKCIKCIFIFEVIFIFRSLVCVCVCVCVAPSSEVRWVMVSELSPSQLIGSLLSVSLSFWEKPKDWGGEREERRGDLVCFSAY